MAMCQKVLSTPFREQVISLSALPISEDEQDLHLPLVPKQGSESIYIKCSVQFRQSDQLFVCFSGCTIGLPVTK